MSVKLTYDMQLSDNVLAYDNQLITISNLQLISTFKKAWVCPPVIPISSHDDVIKWKYFPCHWPSVRRIHRSLSPANSPTKANDAELWCFHWSEPEQTVEQTIDAGDLRCHCTLYDHTVMYFSYDVVFIFIFSALICFVKNVLLLNNNTGQCH